MKTIRWSVALFAVALIGACGSSYADAPAYRTGADPVRPDAPSRSPYRVDIVGAGAYRLPTYYYNGRSYVLGAIGERYKIRIVNPTNRRVEAVVSVDGLDAVDGRTADFAKRGYVIAPHDEVQIDGFRTSMDEVATFRFSSVRDSYAGRKGDDRNVGVIGVAFFPEKQRPRPMPRPIEQRRGYDAAPESAAAPSAPPSYDKREAGNARPSEAKSRAAEPAERPGLGTEFGERRTSSVDYTTFQRANRSTPSSVVEIRYNDREGLLALGIPVDGDRPVDDDLDQRERANPFPRNRFATPPP